ncbi:hypothetical protein M434DRAFT_13143 [Hypoxylon sp. CO27-5]|nr:hypothetical protein M434DRAFT_13143 [Hypoxylon sp. CO27-5]
MSNLQGCIEFRILPNSTPATPQMDTYAKIKGIGVLTTVFGAGELSASTFNDEDFRCSAQMYAHVTMAQASLKDPRTIPDQLTPAQSTSLYHFPSDLAAVPISAEQLRFRFNMSISSVELKAHQDSAISKILNKTYEAKQLILYVDDETRSLGIVDDVGRLVKSTG